MPKTNSSILPVVDSLAEKETELKLMRNNPINKDSIFALVEGVDDYKFYGAYFATNVCFYVTSSSHYIPQILQDLNVSPLFQDRIFGIADSDFRNLTDNKDSFANLFYTDTHDWEIMTLTESAERRICRECEIDYQVGLFSQMLDHIKSLSLFRYYNEIKVLRENCPGINFEGRKIQLIYDGFNPIQFTSCYKHIKSLNSAHSVFPIANEVENFIVENSNVDLLQATQGHDFIHALSKRISVIGAKPCKLSIDSLSLLLRTAFVLSDFKQTTMYVQIKDWSEGLGLTLFES